MTLDEKLRDRFKTLIAEAQRELASCGWPGRDSTNPDIVAHMRFRTEAMNLVRKACGDMSDHYRELRALAENQVTALNPHYYPNTLGVLQAAQRDYEAGLVFDLRSIVAAEVFGDLMEQAEHLLKSKYFAPAASLTGAILEDGLRKLAGKLQVPVPEQTTLDRLNADLAKAGAYSKLIQKNITAYTDVRNNADHGHFDKFKPEDVEAMVTWVRRFLAEHLG